MSSVGYPGKFSTGKIIEGLTGVDQMSGVKVLHAGTRRSGDALVTSGGRVLGITTFDATLVEALAKAYAAAGQIRFEGMHYRTDIGGGGGRAQSAGD